MYPKSGTWVFGNSNYSTGFGFQDLPKGSNVVPFWVFYCFLVVDYNTLPQKGTT